MRSQKQRILDALHLEPRCSLEFLDWTPRITRGAARIQDLKDDGHTIMSDTCRLHDYETATHVKYTLATSDQLSFL